jgi:hypothetical protein
VVTPTLIGPGYTVPRPQQVRPQVCDPVQWLQVYVIVQSSLQNKVLMYQTNTFNLSLPPGHPSDNTKTVCARQSVTQ